MANTTHEKSALISFGTLMDATEQIVHSGGEVVFGGNYTPHLYRENPRYREIESLIDYFRDLLVSPTTETSPKCTAILAGESGTGKSFVVRALYRELETFVRRRRLPALRYVTLSCRINQTKHSMLEEILRQLEGGSSQQYNLEAQITDILEEQDLSILVAMDDFDAIKTPIQRDIVETLIGMRQQFPDASRLNLILFTRKDSVAQELADGLVTKQPLGRLVHFLPYSKDELLTILKERAQLGLHRQSWNDNILSFIVELNGEGNAWVSIDLLTRAISIAIEESAMEISFDHVRSAYLKPPIDRSTFKDLNEREQLMLLSLTILTQETQRLKFPPKEVKQKYEQLCDRSGRPPMGGTVQHNWLNGLERRGFILQERNPELNRVEHVKLGTIDPNDISQSLSYLLDEE